MTNIFKSTAKTAIGITPVIIYTSPQGTTSTIIGMSLANIISTDITVDILIHKSSVNRDAAIVKNVVIPTGTSLVPIGGEQKVVLESGDYIEVSSNTASSVDVILSILETS